MLSLKVFNHGGTLGNKLIISYHKKNEINKE